MTLLTDDEVRDIVKAASNGSALRQMNQTPTSVRISRAIESAVLAKMGAQEPCQHSIADIRNPVVTSGYMCVKCGALFSAADHSAPVQARSEPVFKDAPLPPYLGAYPASIIQAAPVQQEPVGYTDPDCLKRQDEIIRKLVKENEELDNQLTQALQERDRYHDVADALAAGVARHFDADIGEHSNMNDPWQNALDFLEGGECAEVAKPAPVQQEPVAELVELVGVKNGVETSLGKVAMPPRMKAREIAREQFGAFQDDDGSDADFCFGALETLIDWMFQQGYKLHPAPVQQEPVNQQLLEALKRVISASSVDEYGAALDKARAAIAGVAPVQQEPTVKDSLTVRIAELEAQNKQLLEALRRALVGLAGINTKVEFEIVNAAITAVEKQT